MSNALDLLAQYAASGVQTPASASSFLPSTANVALTAEQKKADVANAAETKMAVMNQGQNNPTNYQTALAAQTGQGLSAMDERQRDAATMDPLSLYAKYGNQATQMMSDRAAGARALRQDQSIAPRSGSQIAADSITGVGLGLANSVGGLASLGTGIVAPQTNLGPAMAKSLQDLNEFGQSTQSPQLKAARNVQENLTALQTPVREAQQQADKAAGDSGFMAGLKRVGRDALDSAGRLADSPELIGDIAAQGVGSILTAGPMARGLSAAGAAVVPKTTQAGIQAAAAIDASVGNWSAARVANFIGTKWTMPAAISAQEAGGAYQSNAGDISQASFADLQKNSPMFNELVSRGATKEEARAQVANRAGILAAAIQAPLAAATGVIASKFEAHPFSVPSLREAGRNILKEGAEETLQSVTGQLSQNQAKSMTSDINQNLAEGVGDQAVQGLVGGLGSAGMVQAPGSLFHASTGAALAAVNAVKPVADAAGSLLKPAYEWIAKRGDAVMKANENASPVSDATVTQAAAEAQTAAPEAQATAQAAVQAEPNLTPEQKAQAAEYVDTLAQSTSFDPAEVAGSHPAIEEAVANATNRVDALQKMADYMNDSSKPAADRLAVGGALNQILGGLEQYINSNPKALESLPENHAARTFAEGVSSLIASLQESPKVQRAQRNMDTLVEKQAELVKPVTAESLNTQQGLVDAQTHIGIAEVAPAKADLGSVEMILKQAAAGKIQLNDKQTAALKTAAAILNAAKTYDSAMEAAGMSKQDFVGKQIKTDDSRGPGQYSALQHAQVIRAAVRSGDLDIARAQLVDFGKFVQHMQNKVGAINEHLATGNGNKDASVKYQALSSNADRSWVESRKGLGVTPTNEKSVEFAKRVGAEAQALTDLHNALADAFPELKVKHMKQAPLDPKLANGTPAEVAALFRNQPVQAQEVKTEAPAKQEPVATKDSAPAQVEQKQTVTETVKDQNPIKTETQAQQATPVTEEPVVKKEGVAAVYPSLVQPASGNKFTTSFKLPKEATSRLIGSESPVAYVREAIKDNGVKMDRAMQKEYGKVLDNAERIADNMRAQLATFLKNKDVGKRFLAGEEAHRWQSGKLLNLVEEVNGKLQYNEELLQSSALAAAQWLLNSNQYGQIIDQGDVANLFGVAPENVTDAMMNAMSEGMSVNEATSSLAQKIQSYWGVQADRNAPEGYTRGIPLSMAAELIRAMEANGDLQVNTVKFEGITKTPMRIIPQAIPADALIKSYPDAIERAVAVEPEQMNYFGKDRPAVAKTQLRNPAVENTPSQVEAISREQETPHYINPSMVELYEQLGRDTVLSLFGAGNLDARTLNVNHRATLEGQNMTTGAAFEQLQQVVAELRRKADEEGVAHDQMPIHYGYNMTRVGRLQMLGKYNPQSSKLVREAILPTRSTLNLSDADDRQRFMLGVAQALGVKVHNMLPADSIAKTQKMLDGEFKPVVDALVAFNKTGKIDAEALAGKGLTPLSLHHINEYARSLDAKGDFLTTAYLEADGMTNGPVNAMALLSRGAFTESWLSNMGKGGLWFGGDESQNSQVYRSQVDGKDLYQATTDALADNLKQMRKGLNQEGNETTLAQQNALVRLMDMFLPDLSIKEDGSLDLSRGIAKNPLTITVYGSGARGIAGKLTSSISDSIYERMSQAAEAMAADKSLTLSEAMFGPEGQAKFDQFADLLGQLTSTVAGKGKDGLFVKAAESAPLSIKDPVTFTLHPKQIANLSENMLHLFVTPLREAINSTVGETLMESADMIRKATQAQSIFLEHAFKDAVEKAVADKEKNDPNYKKGEFLSAAELDSIMKSLDHLAPQIDTGSQRFFIAGNQNVDVNAGDFGRALNDQFRTQANIYGPADSGVAGVPFLNIGMGDGMMMQNIATMKGAPKNTLKIFDGMNMRLDSIYEDSVKANQAVYDSWQGNPLKAVSDTFSEFMKNATFDNMSDAMKESLVKSLVAPFADAKDYTPAQVHAAMELLGEQLKRGAMEAEARHKAVARVNVSVDQMAATGSPFRVTNKEAIGGTNEEILAKLNTLYGEEMAKLSKAEPKSDISKDLRSVGRADSTGAQVLSYTALTNLGKAVALPEGQAQMFKEIQKSMAAKGYKVVFGDAKQLAAYSAKNSLGLDGSLFGPDTNGFTAISNKTIFLKNPSSETLVHEMIHAATYENVLNHYEGSSTPVVKQAVQNLEGLMAQFLSMGDQVAKMPAEMQTAHTHAVNEINARLNDATLDTASQKAAGMNEFMAWALTNENLVRAAKRVEANPLVRMAKAVIDGIKAIVWGRKAVPQPTPGKDLFSNLLFNSAVLVNSQPSVQAISKDTTLFQNQAYGTDDRLQRLQDSFDKTITDYISEASGLEQANRTSKAQLAIAQAVTVSKAVQSAFPMTAQEAKTFESVVAALATEAAIDSHALNRAHEIHSEVVKKLGVEHFLPEGFENMDPVYQTIAQQQYSAALGLNNAEVDAQGRSTILPTFLALAMTNDTFRQALSKIELPKRAKSDGASIADRALENLASAALDQLSKRLSSTANAGTTLQALDALSDRIATIAQDHQVFADQIQNPLGSAVDRANDFVVEGIQALADKASDAFTQMGNAVHSDGLKAVAALGRISTKLATDAGAEHVAEGVLAGMNRLNGMNPLRDFMSDLVGRTDSNKDVYDMIKQVRADVHQDRQNYRENLPNIIASKFSRELSPQEWTQLHQGMGKTDLASLLDGMSKKDVLEVLGSQNKLDAEVNAKEKELQALYPNDFATLQTKMQQLAKYMMTGAPGTNLLRNAFAISRLYGETKSRDFKNGDKAVQRLIDHLTSLYALDQVGVADKVALSTLVDKEGAGMDFTLSYLKGQRAEETRKIADSQRAIQNHFKGWLPSEASQGVSLFVAPDSEFSKLAEMSYQRIGSYKGSKADGNQGKQSYYFAPVSGRTAFNQGILQNVRHTASGVDAATGFMTGPTAGRITDKQQVAAAVRSLAREGNTAEPLMPVYDAAGNVVAFERALDPAMLARLNPDTNLAKSIGQWRGRQVEEIKSQAFNDALIDRLHDMYTKAIQSNPASKAEFVNINDPRELARDKVLADAVKLMTQETKNKVEDVFGDEFYVRKDLLKDALGYRSASVGDPWTGTSRWSDEALHQAKRIALGIFGHDAYKMVTKGENFIKGAVTEAKSIIVVKSVIVPFVNAMSNVIQMAARGVPMTSMVTGFPKKLSELNQYTTSRIRQIQAEAELRASDDINKTLKLKAEIQAISDSHKRMSIWPLIEAGEFTAVSAADNLIPEDVNLASGKLRAYFESLVDKLPQAVRNAGKYAIVHKDTALYQGLQKAVNYSDFVAKAVMFDDLTKRKGMSKEEALGRITEEFVNYDRLPGRFRNYMESMGMLWFYNFKIRSTKVAASMIRNNPVHTLLATLAPTHEVFGSVGLPTEDNMFSKLLDGKLSYSFGLGQGIHSPMLNPWVQLAH